MRAKTFIRTKYLLRENPFPQTAIVNWGSRDGKENGSLFNARVCPDRYEEAITKFVVNPVDAGSKFHFLWSLGDAVEARGFGKTALLNYLARTINRDLGFDLLSTHGFDESEARETPILAAMAAFDTQRVTSLAAVSLEHVKYIVQGDGDDSVLPRLRNRLVRRHLAEDRVEGDDQPSEPRIAEAISEQLRRTNLSIGGKTFGGLDRKFSSLFAAGDIEGLREYVNQAPPKSGYDLLHTMFVVARAAGVPRVFLLIDQVEDFANADIPRKRRHMEVERFRDLAIETQPFGEMASYVLTMHPEAARAIEEFWSLARLPKIDYMSRQSERVTVILRQLETRGEVENLVVPYLNHYRVETPPMPLFPFDSAALDLLRELSGGRPGEILKNAHEILAAGADHQWLQIGRGEIEHHFEQDVSAGRHAPLGTGRRRLGSID